jgi:hypothetical protein
MRYLCLADVKDILAVAYGKNTDIQAEDNGLILVWSVKNPEVFYV